MILIIGPHKTNIRKLSSDFNKIPVNRIKTWTGSWKTPCFLTIQWHIIVV